MKNIIISLILIVLCQFSYGQETNINDYKYFVLESRFDFLKKRDQYSTSSLTKFLFEKEGFKVFFNDTPLPKEVKDNRCNSLYIDVKDDSSLLTVKNKIVIKDCTNQTIFESDLVSSKYKDYKKAYHQTIRKAFENVKELNYEYSPKIDELISEKAVDTEITTLPKTILYAQPVENGFQLINTKPEVIFVLIKTNVQDVFIIKDKNGIFYKKNGIWFAEYFDKNSKVIKEYKVKF